MTADKASASEPRKPLTVRPACLHDFDAFIELARLCMEELGRPFSEADARWAFAGIPRTDPLIHVLLDADEIVGFVLVRCSTAPLTQVTRMYQEQLFVRADRRSKDAEMLLHRMTLEGFKGLPPGSEIHLLVDASPYAFDLIGELKALGFQDTQIRMRAVRLAPSEQPDPAASPEEAERATLH